MNIAIFASAFHPSLGGVEEAVRQIVHEYERQGSSAIVLTNRWPRRLPRMEVFEGIPVYRLAMRLSEYNAKVRLAYWLARPFTRAKMLRILKRHEIDILHVHCVSANGHYAAMAKRALGLPLIVTAHGERIMDADHIYETSACLNGILRQLLESADHITACSRSTLEDLEGYNGSSFGARASVVYSGVRSEDFAAGSAERRDRPYILAMGRMVRQKGFDLLIRAFAATGVESHDLVIGGDGPERENLKQLAHELGMSGRIDFPGRADRDRAAALFKGCSFFVMPSRIEPMGIVNLEAMAAGKAVVAADTGGVSEIVLAGETGLLFPPESVDLLASAIKQLSGDETLRRRLGESGRERVQHFEWSRIAKQYSAIYRHTMDGGRRADLTCSQSTAPA